jgi:diguanylate cyclase (GGDEF)-like protein
MPKIIDISQMTELDAKTISEIQNLACEIFIGGQQTREENIEFLISEVICHLEVIQNTDLFSGSVAVFFDAAFSCMLSQRVTHSSDLYRFFTIMNHLPVLESSHFYSETLDILAPHFRKDRSLIKLFDRLQLLFVFTNIGYFDAARLLAEDLENHVREDQLCFYAMYQLSRYQLHSAAEEVSHMMKLLLNLATRTWDSEGPEATLYLMTNWLFSLSWFKPSKYYKVLLGNLYHKIRKRKSLNSAIVGYELFSLQEKQVSPPERMRYYQDLIQYQDNVLNSRQLHSLHFFAGNYLSGMQKQFRDSIQSFKASNYYLHKCWERLIGISKYLRAHSNPNDYKLGMQYLEEKFLRLSNQTSLRNNSYVENLQGNFEKIEKLYQQVGELSLTDSLSGQRNRRFMDNNLPQIMALAARHNAPVCFAIMDIDYFKEINDTYGHAAGDHILTDLGRLLSSEFRQSDIIIRYGGDEFLLVLFDTELQHCKTVLQSFCSKIGQHSFKFKRKKIHVTISVGAWCEVFDKKSKLNSLESYICKADAALYKAKKAGRNSVIIQQ